MRGGEKEVLLSHFLEADTLPPKVRLMATITLIPGASIGEHTHENECEIFYIMQGCGTYLNEGAYIDIAKGDVLLCPSGGTHSIANNGNEDLILTATIVLD